MDARLRAQVRDRAGGRCEYCRIHEDDDPFFTFAINHPDAVILRELLIAEGRFPG